MTINELIAGITPLYNEYRKNRDDALPVNQIALMWKIGDQINDYLKKTGAAPHALYREIYGKSESTSNISQRSYITREFLGRSYRVRNMFRSLGEIKKTFTNLTSLSHFREAMPFFDNSKYKLPTAEMTKLIAVLNSNKSNVTKTNYVAGLQKSKINRKNPRTQRLGDWQVEKELFIQFYNQLYKAVHELSFVTARQELHSPSNDFVKILAQNTGALSADGLKMNPMEIPDTMDSLWQEYTALVARLIEKESPIERRRFRRLIPADRLVRLSEMLYALTEEQSFNNLKAK